MTGDEEIPIGEVEVGTRLVAADSGWARRCEAVERNDDGEVRIKPVGLPWSPWVAKTALVMVRP